MKKFLLLFAFWGLIFFTTNKITHAEELVYCDTQILYCCDNTAHIVVICCTSGYEGMEQIMIWSSLLCGPCN
jgi:hypothetical protein